MPQSVSKSRSKTVRAKGVAGTPSSPEQGILQNTRRVKKFSKLIASFQGADDEEQQDDEIYTFTPPHKQAKSVFETQDAESIPFEEENRLNSSMLQKQGLTIPTGTKAIGRDVLHNEVAVDEYHGENRSISTAVKKKNSRQSPQHAISSIFSKLDDVSNATEEHQEIQEPSFAVEATVSQKNIITTPTTPLVPTARSGKTEQIQVETPTPKDTKSQRLARYSGSYSVDDEVTQELSSQQEEGVPKTVQFGERARVHGREKHAWSLRKKTFPVHDKESARPSKSLQSIQQEVEGLLQDTSFLDSTPLMQTKIWSREATPIDLNAQEEETQLIRQDLDVSSTDQLEISGDLQEVDQSAKPKDVIEGPLMRTSNKYGDNDHHNRSLSQFVSPSSNISVRKRASVPFLSPFEVSMTPIRRVPGDHTSHTLTPATKLVSDLVNELETSMSSIQDVQTSVVEQKQQEGQQRHKISQLNDLQKYLRDTKITTVTSHLDISSGAVRSVQRQEETGVYSELANVSRELRQLEEELHHIEGELQSITFTQVHLEESIFQKQHMQQTLVEEKQKKSMELDDVRNISHRAPQYSQPSTPVQRDRDMATTIQDSAISNGNISTLLQSSSRSHFLNSSVRSISPPLSPSQLEQKATHKKPRYHSSTPPQHPLELEKRLNRTF